ncbi:MAG: twin-arginine translocase TatA/TatE family subunit [Nitrospinae bacterium]|nr:twin-arginine translocase TatA/TatE family subunit [Nitrospinota bacterium]
MFGVGMPELIVILVILLVVFGASRLPEIGSGMGKGIRNFKKSLSDAEKEVNEAAKPAESVKKDS